MQPPVPFFGFPPEAARFYADLDANNDRDWFEAHKADWLEHVVEPAQGLIDTLGRRLEALHQDVHYGTQRNGTGSMFRIYRDTRFRPDAPPYKTHLGLLWWLGEGRKNDRPGYYLHLDGAGTPQLFAGWYGFSKAPLQAFRETVASETGEELRVLLHDLREAGWEVRGERLKRGPQGSDPDHPRADLLRYKGLYAAAPPCPADLADSPELVDRLYAQAKESAPFLRWLDELYP